MISSSTHKRRKIPIGLSHNGEYFLSEPVPLAPAQVNLTRQDLPNISTAPLKTITQNRQTLQAMTLILPNGSSLTMSSLRQFSAQSPRYHYDEATSAR